MAAEAYGVDARLMRAIACVESGFNPKATGDHGHSHGLFQINDFWLKRYGVPVDAIYRPDVNAMWAAFILRRCFDRYPHHFWRAVGCYNAGSATAPDSIRGRYAWRVYRAMRRERLSSRRSGRSEPVCASARSGERPPEP